MAKYVFVIGTADTKRDELLWLESCFRSSGVDTCVVDVSTATPASVDDSSKIDISALQVADYHPVGQKAVFCGERGNAVSAMSEALTLFLLSSVDDIAGVVGIGGSGGTALITAAMRSLPIGIPKLMVSTMASGNVSGYVGVSDIAMLNTVTDLCGLNKISRSILANAANMIAGAVNNAISFPVAKRPMLGLTMFGVTTPCINQLINNLSDDFESIVFHATGNGGMSMEKLVSDRELVGVIDITLTEIADLLFDGVLACPSTRLDQIAKSKIPWVGSCGALDMVNFGARTTIPEKYKNRQLIEHNEQVTLMRTTPEENREIGVWIGNKINQFEGEARFFIPQGGFSSLDCPGQPFHSVVAMESFTDALEKTVVQTNKRVIVKTPYHINSPEFVSLVMKGFLDALHQGKL